MLVFPKRTRSRKNKQKLQALKAFEKVDINFVYFVQVDTYSHIYFETVASSSRGLLIAPLHYYICSFSFRKESKKNKDTIETICNIIY